LNGIQEVAGSIPAGSTTSYFLGYSSDFRLIRRLVTAEIDLGSVVT
jgi:hypothetical protein